MQLDTFSYHLPADRIAQTPVDPRDHSRLLVVDRKQAQFSHHHFYDLPQLLEPGDLLVINNTRVLPVRLYGQKETGGKVEILLTKRYEINEDSETWQALSKPGLKVGQSVHCVSDDGKTQLTITCLEEESYTRRVKTSLSGAALLSSLEVLGEMPTPPYIEKFVGDPERYQTIFAKNSGSAAAPTAGLHFTPEVFAQLKAHHIDVAEVTLHVGLGTFLPVKVDDITQHHMHSEWYDLPTATAKKINQTKANGGRVIAVGTTSMRTLESAAVVDGKIQADSGETTLFVYPPHAFTTCDGMITNFHLPESTLLMLVSAFCSAPQTNIPFQTFATSLLGKAYQEAIENNYRFFSFGDAMLIL